MRLLDPEMPWVEPRLPGWESQPTPASLAKRSELHVGYTHLSPPRVGVEVGVLGASCFFQVGARLPLAYPLGFQPADMQDLRIHEAGGGQGWTADWCRISG